MANSHKSFLFICFWMVKWFSMPHVQQGRSVWGGGGETRCHWPLHSNWQYFTLSAQGKFEWVIFQCYLSWMYDRFCTLDKEKSNNNGNPEKKSLILISFSVYQKPFSIKCEKISLKSIRILAALFPQNMLTMKYSKCTYVSKCEMLFIF